MPQKNSRHHDVGCNGMKNHQLTSQSSIQSSGLHQDHPNKTAAMVGKNQANATNKIAKETAYSLGSPPTESWQASTMSQALGCARTAKAILPGHVSDQASLSQWAKQAQDKISWRILIGAFIKRARNALVRVPTL